MSATDKPTTTNPLEQFTILARSTKGLSSVQLIKQVLEASNIFVFGELLDVASIQELKTGPHKPYWDLLYVFAFGTVADYEESQSSLPQLSDVMVKKLRMLTIVSLASQSKCIPYSDLLRALRLSNLRELEDLIIEAIYADLVKGKLDQAHQMLEVDYVMGRDVKSEALPAIIRTMEEWSALCSRTLDDVHTQIAAANAWKDEANKKKQAKEQEITNIKATLKATQQEGEDTLVAADGIFLSEKDKKKTRQKGLRGSAKLSQFLHKS